MEQAYAQALWSVVRAGKSPKEAVDSLAALLRKQGRAELMPRIKRALVRIAQRESAMRPRLYVAHEKDAHKALHASGVHDADVQVDKTLIGGWRLETAQELLDTSFKNQLLSIYSKVTE